MANQLAIDEESPLAEAVRDPFPTEDVLVWKISTAVVFIWTVRKVTGVLEGFAIGWATVVLLGGFVGALTDEDFWIVTILVALQAGNILSSFHRSVLAIFSEQLRGYFPQLLGTYCSLLLFGSIGDDSSSPHVLSDRICLVLKASVMFISSSLVLVLVFPIHLVLLVLGLFTSYFPVIVASASVLLPIVRVYYSKIVKDPQNKHLKPALYIFYTLVELEGILYFILFLLRRSRDRYTRELQKVCKFGDWWLDSIDQYFIYVQKKLENSFFPSVTDFAVELLNSDKDKDHLSAALILNFLLEQENYVAETLSAIKSSNQSVFKLIKLLELKDQDHKEIRGLAARIVLKFDFKIHLAQFPTALELIASLLVHSEVESNGETGRTDSRLIVLGLQILERLALDRENCMEIAKYQDRDLVSQIIALMSDRESATHEDGNPIEVVKGSLEVVSRLVSKNGETGLLLRHMIARDVFLVSNIAAILKAGASDLEELAIDILTNLAFDSTARTQIGRTGDIINMLFIKFFGETSSVGKAAGGTLAMLTFYNMSNCLTILKITDVVQRLIHMLSDDEHKEYKLKATKILRNLYANSNSYFRDRINLVSSALPEVLKGIHNEKEELLEASICLCVQISQFTRPEELSIALDISHITEREFVKKLREILHEDKLPTTVYPRIRRATIELVKWMMLSDSYNIYLFKDCGMEESLTKVEKTTRELEEYELFCGNEGIAKHSEPLSSLVQSVVQLITTS